MRATVNNKLWLFFILLALPGLNSEQPRLPLLLLLLLLLLLDSNWAPASSSRKEEVAADERK